MMTSNPMVTKRTPAKVLYAGKEVSIEFGIKYVPTSDSHRLRRVWGRVNNTGDNLTMVAYDVETSGPAKLIRDMARHGLDTFVLHYGLPIVITRDELLRVGREMELIAPETFCDVPVPDSLLSNWSEVEAKWWRDGVRAAVAHHEGPEAVA